MTNTNRSEDRRIARTHEALRSALIASILELGWDRTTVQEICARANIGRSTFYSHFASKEMLLESGIDELRRMLQGAVATDETKAMFGFVRGLIDHVDENQRLFRAVIGKRSGLVVQRHFRQLLNQLVREDIDKRGIPADKREMATHYLAGALFDVMTWWIDTRCSLPTRQLESRFKEMSLPVVEGLLAK